MKYVTDFRDPERIERVRRALEAACTRAWTVMEICGGQTHTIARYALPDILPRSLELVHGPGCPVCVTPLEILGAAYSLSLLPGVTLCSFGDMLRVPGPNGDLLLARAEGGDVRLVLSPLDAVALAERERTRQVVFLAVGFETTAPAVAFAVARARDLGLDNFSVLVGHVRVPPAMEVILSAPDNRVQGFLAAGHVCTVTGTSEYPELASRYGIPIVVGGFEPLDILLGLLQLVRMLEAGRTGVCNGYERAVQPLGNVLAQQWVARVFEVADRPWRGLGVIPQGGLRLRAEYAAFDATQVHGLRLAPVAEPEECLAAQVLRGRLSPPACPAFGTRCTPEHPLGAPMVSTEGACAAYYRYRKNPVEVHP